MLAVELAAHADHAAAFAAYEGGTREFVELNQALAVGGAASLTPRTAEDLEARNRALRDPALLPGDDGQSATTALTLPDLDDGAPATTTRGRLRRYDSAQPAGGRPTSMLTARDAE
jgi:hypothetical protein